MRYDWMKCGLAGLWGDMRHSQMINATFGWDEMICTMIPLCTIEWLGKYIFYERGVSGWLLSSAFFSLLFLLSTRHLVTANRLWTHLEELSLSPIELRNESHKGDEVTSKEPNRVERDAHQRVWRYLCKLRWRLRYLGRTERQRHM